MRLLLDSHAALWWLGDLDRLGDGAREMITEADEVFCSAVTPWEHGIKRARGKLDHPDDLLGAFTTTGFAELPITAQHAIHAVGLPDHHRDPFDRMLIAQAREESLTLVTADDSMHRYDVDILAADE